MGVTENKRKHIQHYRTDKFDREPKLSEIKDGEIAIRYTKGNEALFIKNDENELVTLPIGYTDDIPTFFSEDDAIKEGATEYLLVQSETDVITTEYDETISRMEKTIDSLNEKIAKLEATLNGTLVVGNSKFYDVANSTANDVKPDIGDEETDRDENQKPIDTDFMEPTNPEYYHVNHLTIKWGQSANLTEIKRQMIPHELLYIEDTSRFYIMKSDGTLKLINGGMSPISGDESNNNQDNNDINIIMDNLEYIKFIDESNDTYITKVSNGSLITQKINSADVEPHVNNADGKTNTYIFINSFFFADANSDSDNLTTNAKCSHEFVELLNASGKAINLNDYVLYYYTLNEKIYSLRLNGIIDSHSTYLVRCSDAVSSKSGDVLVNVPSYDIEWFVDDNGKSTYFNDGEEVTYTRKDLTDKKISLLRFLGSSNNKKGTLYLRYEPIGTAPFNYEVSGVSELWSTSKGCSTIDKNNFADAVTFDGAVCDSPVQYTQVNNGYADTALVTRNYNMDFTSQALKVNYIDRKNTVYRIIDLNTTKSIDIETLQPKASFEKKSIYSVSSKLDSTHPNFVSIAYGIDGHNTRCFNWVSVGLHDEFLYYKKVGETYWNIVESFNSSDNRKSYTSSVYNRKSLTFTDGTFATSHKVIVTNLGDTSDVTYEYKVGREGCMSESRYFTVRAPKTSFNFIQHSDEQGFTKNEYYTAWKSSANYIAMNEKYDFSVDTGDMSQNGNRLSEWIDYFESGQRMFNNEFSNNGVEQMNVVGNNDLAPIIFSKEPIIENSLDAKASSQLFSFFFCNEFDENNMPICNGELVPSTYSFNYNGVHFVMLNTELPNGISSDAPLTPAQQTIYNTASLYVNSMKNSDGEYGWSVSKWLMNDLNAYYKAQTVKGAKKKVVVSCHEMPWTILTYDAGVMKGGARGGSRANTCGEVKDASITYDSAGKRSINGAVQSWSTYWLSRLLELYKVKLCIGGHKHTYSWSFPIRENYDATTETIASYAQSADKGTLNYDDLIAFLKETEIADTKTVYRQNIETTNSKYIKADVENDGISDSSIHLIVKSPESNEHTGYVTYVMCQATGFKLTSNKELPAPKECNTGLRYLRGYFPATYPDASVAKGTVKASIGQKKPFYIKWVVTDNDILGIPMRANVYNSNIETPLDVTFSQTYGDTNWNNDVNQNNYKITW